jgi:hypothetical protein
MLKHISEPTMNVTPFLNEAINAKKNKNDSQLNVLISKDELLAFKAYAKANGTDASKLTRAFIQAILKRKDKV